MCCILTTKLDGINESVEVPPTSAETCSSPLLTVVYLQVRRFGADITG